MSRLPAAFSPTHRRLISLAPAFSAFLLAACSPEARRLDQVTVRDSAGIQIVENSGTGSWGGGEAWRLSDEPSLQIGSAGDASETQLFQVEDAVRLSDGRIVVANRGTGELLFFDPRGRLIFTAGGKGGGPGEFSADGAPAALDRIGGDTVLAYDILARRISVFGPDGAFVRSTPLVMAGKTAPLSMPVGWLEDGSFVAFTLHSGARFRPSSEQSLSRSSVTLLFFDAKGTLTDSAGRFPGREMYRSISGSGIRFSLSVRPRPLGRSFEAATSNRTVAVGSTDAYEIRLYSVAGRLERIVRRSGQGRPVTRELIDTWIQERISAIKDPAARRRSRLQYDEMTFPDRLPAFASLIVDTGGQLWVKEYDPLDVPMPGRWSVYDRQGLFLGQVETPRAFRPFEIGQDYVLGLWKDELGIEYVRLYGLEKPVRELR